MRVFSGVLRCLAPGLVVLMAAGCAKVSPPPDMALPAATPGSPEAKAQLALYLAAQARRDRDARAMLVAARLMLTSGTRPARLLDGRLQAETGPDPLATAWAREAALFAAGDATLRAEAEALQAMRPRGVMGSSLGSGPLRYVQRISANDTVRIAISTQPQTAARVAAIGDGDALIGLGIHAAGEMICEQVARTTHTLCAWHALTNRYEVTLVNRGPLGSDVMLLSN